MAAASGPPTRQMPRVLVPGFVMKIEACVQSVNKKHGLNAQSGFKAGTVTSGSSVGGCGRPIVGARREFAPDEIDEEAGSRENDAPPDEELLVAHEERREENIEPAGERYEAR